MTDTADFASKHRMDLTIRENKLAADFTCIEHEPCELVDMIRNADEQESSDFFFLYPAVLIWCRNEDSQLLRSGEVDIQKKVFPWGTIFVEWDYAEFVSSYNQFNDNSDPKHDHALVGAVGADTHEANFAVKCLHEFEVMDWCPGQELNLKTEKLFTSYAGNDGTQFKNGYIHLIEKGQGEDWEVQWQYEEDLPPF
jgi:hypothetical protein